MQVIFRPRSESNRRIGVLQTPALPLGYVAVKKLYLYLINLQLNLPTSVQLKKRRRQRLHPRFRP